jgi:hypothetical protein
MCGSVTNATSLSPVMITFIPHLMVSADNAGSLSNVHLGTETVCVDSIMMVHFADLAC